MVSGKHHSVQSAWRLGWFRDGLIRDRRLSPSNSGRGVGGGGGGGGVRGGHWMLGEEKSVCREVQIWRGSGGSIEKRRGVGAIPAASALITREDGISGRVL